MFCRTVYINKMHVGMNNKSPCLHCGKAISGIQSVSWQIQNWTNCGDFILEKWYVKCVLFCKLAFWSCSIVNLTLIDWVLTMWKSITFKEIICVSTYCVGIHHWNHCNLFSKITSNTEGCIIDIVFFLKGRHGTVCQNTRNNFNPMAVVMLRVPNNIASVLRKTPLVYCM